ncbi:MAG: UTP--glucose-1-phosphate uridylyltransferase [Planctomycetales bacterium]|nr:UTP--glucose-1-phosphate uridylyltransferase [Planctomycetales bacterium]
MSEPVDRKELQAALAKFGQEHLLAFWDELDAAGQTQLAAQIRGIDLELVDSLFRGDVDQPDWAELSRRATPPPAMRLAERQAGKASALGITPNEATERGQQALAAGEIGVLLVAGGQGSRLGFEKPKSLYPIGPLSHATLLQIHVEKALAVAARYGTAMPLYLMTSPATHDDTAAFLAEHDNLGMPADDLVVFCQGTMPAVDATTGKLLLSAKDSLFLSPDGHGGTVAALAGSGAIDHMRSRGVKHLFYLQVDNPLAPIGDAEFIGYHLLADSELTSLTVAKQEAHDKLGNFAMVDDRLQVIEYSDFPADVAERRDSSGNLAFWAGSVAIHMFSVAFLEKSLTLKDSLPFHVAKKKVPFINAQGERIEPTETNALKFERFIFDLLPQAARPIVVEYAEEEVFAPLKNAPGAPKDTPEYVQRFMLQQHHRWLAAAGAEISPGVAVEISPLWALDAVGVAERVSVNDKFDEPRYLAPS